MIRTSMLFFHAYNASSKHLLCLRDWAITHHEMSSASNNTSYYGTHHHHLTQDRTLIELIMSSRLLVTILCNKITLYSYSTALLHRPPSWQDLLTSPSQHVSSHSQSSPNASSSTTDIELCLDVLVGSGEGAYVVIDACLMKEEHYVVAIWSWHHHHQFMLSQWLSENTLNKDKVWINFSPPLSSLYDSSTNTEYLHEDCMPATKSQESTCVLHVKLPLYMLYVLLTYYI